MSEMNLVEKRTRLLEIKKEIAWIGTEFANMQNQWDIREGLKMVADRTGMHRSVVDTYMEKHPTRAEKNQIAIWYDYLRDLMKEFKEMKVEVSEDYKSIVNKLLSDLKENSIESYVENNPLKYWI